MRREVKELKKLRKSTLTCSYAVSEPANPLLKGASLDGNYRRVRKLIQLMFYESKN